MQHTMATLAIIAAVAVAGSVGAQQHLFPNRSAPFCARYGGTVTNHTHAFHCPNGNSIRCGAKPGTSEVNDPNGISVETTALSAWLTKAGYTGPAPGCMPPDGANTGGAVLFDMLPNCPGGSGQKCGRTATAWNSCNAAMSLLPSGVMTSPYAMPNVVCYGPIMGSQCSNQKL